MAKKKRVNTEQVRIQNAAKSLVANIRFASIDNQVRSLVVTSSVPNEGKTTIAIALAQAIASLGERVLLVECDMRRRSLANVLGAHSRGGLYAVVCGQMDLEEAVATTSTRGLHFLDVEPHIPNPEAVLNSKRFVAFCESAAASYRYVIFDTPPLTAFVDAAVLSTVVDGTLLVVGENIVRRDELASSHAQLEKAGANLIGAVMNLCKSEKSEYYTEYYSRGGDDSNAPAAPVNAPTSQAVSKPSSPRPVARKASRAAGASHQSAPAAQNPVAAQGLKPIQQTSAKIAPDTTAQFIASIQPGSKK